MSSSPTYSPIRHTPATARTQLATTCKHARYTETHPVQPLKGLREPRAASVSYRASVPAGQGGRGATLSYRASSPGGETWSFPIEGNLSVTPTIVHCSFYIVHCFTFSAKERDSETGLSYFGSRYYNSDLSVWLSVDPMSDKYANLSPYVYCADNPVKLVDPNGEEVFDDIVVHGKNNSSITYKTDLFDMEFKVDIDFGGNYNVSSENIAFGIEYGLEASAVAGTGTSYNGYKQSVTFNGGKYANYCYDYVGGEAQVVGSGFDVSVGAQANYMIGIFLGDPNNATPESFAGDYQGINGSRTIISGKRLTPWGISVDVNISYAVSKSTENKWFVITFGPSVSYGLSKYSKYTAGYNIGASKLLGTPIPTKERSYWDMTRNKIAHPNPLLWLF